MIAEPLEKGLAEDIENEVVQISWTKLVFLLFPLSPSLLHTFTSVTMATYLSVISVSMVTIGRRLESFFRPSLTGICWLPGLFGHLVPSPLVLIYWSMILYLLRYINPFIMDTLIVDNLRIVDR